MAGPEVPGEEESALTYAAALEEESTLAYIAALEEEETAQAERLETEAEDTAPAAFAASEMMEEDAAPAASMPPVDAESPPKEQEEPTDSEDAVFAGEDGILEENFASEADFISSENTVQHVTDTPEEVTASEDENTTTKTTASQNSADYVPTTYILIGRQRLTTRYITDEGDTYKITLAYEDSALIPEDAVLEVREIIESSKEYEEYISRIEDTLEENERVSFARLFDITIWALDGDGNRVEIQPAAPVEVTIELEELTSMMEVAQEMVQDEPQDTVQAQPTITQRRAAIDRRNSSNISALSAPASAMTEEEETPQEEIQSVSGKLQVVHFEDGIYLPDVIESTVNEETVSFVTDGFSVYGVVYTVDFSYSVDGQMYDFSLPGGGFVSFTDLVEVLGIIDGTQFDNATDFLEEVDDVSFSDPELVSVSKAEEDTTVGAIKDVLGLVSEYSAELTEKQIADINAQAVEAGDWALISLKPFNTEESLIITMKNGDVITVKVTDAQIKKTVISATGETYEITVTYGEDAEIPDGAGLEVFEVLEGSSVYGKSYEDYVAYTENALGWEAGAASYARVFDISIVDGEGEKIQPAAGSTVEVRIELADANDERKLNVVHFADEANAGDVIESSTDEQAVSFEAQSFSAYAIVQGPSSLPIGWHKVSSVAELIEMGNSGLYIGHTDGYYYGNTLVNDGNRIGITKTKPAQSYPGSGAAKYYFEQVEGTENQVYVYCYAADGTTKQYVYNGGNNSLSFAANAEDKTAFTVTQNSNGFFKFNNGAWYWNMQGGANGSRFCSYNNANDGNNNVYIWFYDEVTSDPYNLDGKTYGLMNWTGGVVGRAMMGTSENINSLDAMALTVMAKQSNNGDKLFVPNNSDITMWTFHWVDDDNYYLSAVVDGSTKYLKITSGSLEMVSDKEDIQVVPGSGTHAGEICLKSGATTLTYSGTVEKGFVTNGSAGSEWLNLVDISELTSEYFMTYSASKVSVSDESVTNGSRIIVYTRSWNDEKKRYEFYAIDHDGSLVPCYENGDSIQWLGSRLNTLLWNFVEYYWEGTNEPNYYYDLYNQYSEKYIAPQITGGQILSGDTIGINMNGRRNGQYYSPIVAWDDESYAYAGLKVENGKVVACPIDEADDFYFAVMQDIPVDDTLTTVPTIDHTQYGITMKIVDFGTKVGGYNESDKFLGNNTGGAVKTTVPGLLSTALGEDGYPTNSKGESMKSLYNGAQEVNHLFIASTYSGSGYYEFDSTQNFASLDTSTGSFKVYKEIGTMDGDNKNSLKHGQFMPFNDLEAGVFASVNQKNLYSATLSELPNSDPRKYEQMYLVRQPDYYFGVEIEAAFTQTPNGLDDWGHDIIYEFTGDDDFWLYVDGELIIDLGGIHSALPGSVNYSTGDVYVNGTHTTLRTLFESNYRSRNPGASETEVAAYLAQYFDEGSTIFKDYSTHTMRIFYMERGAGASNLHMRFNLASVKPGTVQLSKALSGVDATESVLAEFPYQIIYTKGGDTQEYYLTNQSPDSASETENYVYYKGTNTPVKYESEVHIGGVKYGSVFFLKPGEIAEISFPEDMERYRIVECGINTQVYNEVTVNGQPIAGTVVAKDRTDYSTGAATTEERATVTYQNNVNPDALRTLSITKQLFQEDGSTKIEAGQDSATFSFRLYLATEFDSNLDDAAAGMYVYHVKDPNGNYCVWNASQQKFVALEEGKNDYANLKDDEKKAVSQRTSTYGQISKIPAGYTVEVRNLLAGTQFKVVERPTEIPDGYSFQKYIYNENDYSNTDTDATANTDADAKAWAGVSDTVVANVDPQVDVCNLKGWGLRVNKVWSDADYMSERDATYFAVYTRDNNDNLTLVNQSNTVRRLAYGETTLYWYFLPLPVVGVPFDHYEIREVQLENPTVDDDGNVTKYDNITVLEDGHVLKLRGLQKGETTQAEFNYTVLYQKGEPEEDSNVRVDTVTNNRPGIVLKKKAWDRTDMAGATFTLEDSDSNLIGTFTSNAEGQITVAFLSDDKNYTLTETKTPQGYHGLENPMTIRLHEGEVTIEGLEEEYYELDQGDGRTPTLTIKNQPYTFQAVKIDADTKESLAGVKFELHKQYTVDGVTSIEPTPMSGYEELITDENGMIPKLDQTLPVGTYELREKETPEGYQPLSGYIYFTISETGEITLGTYPEGVELTKESKHEGVLEYVLTIPNYNTRREFTFTKAWRGADGNTKISWPDDKSITVNILQAKGENDKAPGLYATYSITQSDAGTLNTEIGATNDSTLPKLKVIRNSDGVYTFQLEGLPATGSENGITVNYVYYVSEPVVVAGFQNAKYFNGEEQVMGASRIGDSGIICNDQIGYVLPSTGGPGTNFIYLLGIILLALAVAGLALRKKLRA